MSCVRRERRATIVDDFGALPVVRDYILGKDGQPSAPAFEDFGAAVRDLAAPLAGSSEPSLTLGPLASWALSLRPRSAELSHTRSMAAGKLSCCASCSYPWRKPTTTTTLGASFNSSVLSLAIGLRSDARVSRLGVPVEERVATLSATMAPLLEGVKVGFATAHDLRAGGALKSYSAGCEVGDKERGALTATADGVGLCSPAEYTIAASAPPLRLVVRRLVQSGVHPSARTTPRARRLVGPQGSGRPYRPRLSGGGGPPTAPKLRTSHLAPCGRSARG